MCVYIVFVGGGGGGDERGEVGEACIEGRSQKLTNKLA